jgi:site-specific recombinase XerD
MEMETSSLIADERSEQRDTGRGRITIETITSADIKRSVQGAGSSLLGASSPADVSMSFELGRHRREAGKEHTSAFAMSLADFVERRFVPEHVADKTPAGRAHFLGILKHVVSPERVDRAFGVTPGHQSRRNTLAHWPYIGSMRLDEITAERIHNLLSTGLQQGYSIQTITHIRNVIRSIFSHAQKTGHFAGKNPATLVVLPAMAHKETASLSLDQLQQVIQLMRYPVRELTVLTLLTEMSVAEICGLKWKYVNLSYERRRVDGEWLSAKAIAIRTQSYRATVSSAIEPRQRNVLIPDLLCCILRDLKNRKNFTDPEDFVLTSRSGTPISQDNLAARKLKSIGRSLGMPWVSWSVFIRTRVALASELGNLLQDELKRIIPTDVVLPRIPRRPPPDRRPKARN